MKPIFSILAEMLVISIAVGALVATAQSQGSGQNAPLGDVARKSREQRQAKEHASSKHVLDEETASKQGEVWTASACRILPCAQLSVVMPPNSKPGEPSLNVRKIPLDGQKEHDLLIFNGNQLPASDIGSAKWRFLQDWFSRPYFFGAPAKFVFDEDTKIDGNPAVITHFTVNSHMIAYRGTALFVSTLGGPMSFACVFRDDDSGNAESACESVLNTASVKVPKDYKRYDPPSYMNQDF